MCEPLPPSFTPQSSPFYARFLVAERELELTANIVELQNSLEAGVGSPEIVRAFNRDAVSALRRYR